MIRRPPRSTLSLHDALPISTDGGRPIEGLVRSDWTVDEPVATLPLGHRGHRPYPLANADRSEEHTSELQSRLHLVCRLLLEKKKQIAAAPQLDTARHSHSSL